MLPLVSAMLLLCREQDGETCDAQDSTMGAASGSKDSFEDKVSEIMDKVMHSKMMEELKALPSEVMEELKNLPGELRESLLLHVERRSLMVAGVMVAVGAALLLLGCLWIHWCHTEHGEYRYIPVSQVEEFLRYQTPSRSSSAAASTNLRRRRHSSKSRHKHAEGADSKGSVNGGSSSAPAGVRSKRDVVSKGTRTLPQTQGRDPASQLANGGQ